MSSIFTFVVLPLATIIFSIALQKLLRCPVLVSAVIFAIFLILTYTVFGTDFLIFAILFAILAFVTAFLTRLFCRLIKRLRDLENASSNCNCNNEMECGNNGDDTNLLTITAGGTLITNAITNTSNSISNINSNSNCNCNCQCNNANERILLNAEISPNNNGRQGNFRGCFRRR